MLPHFLGRSVSYPEDGSSRSLRNCRNTYQTTRCHTPELVNLDIHRYKDLRDYEDALTGVVSPPNIVERKENKEYLVSPWGVLWVYERNYVLVL